MVMITSLFVAALAGIASAAPTSYSSGSGSMGSSSSYGSSGSMGSSSSYGSSGSMGSSSSYGSSGSMGSSSGSMSSSSSGCDASSGCGGSSSSSAMMMEATSTMSAEMSMSTSSSSYNMPMYGSGSSSSSSSSSSGYDSCVQQCVAQFGTPTSMGSSGSYSSSATTTMGSSGSGATHTVIVAPTKGVLRYVPFAVNASVGDTVMFKWMAGPHTVTKSSILDVCNKTDNAPFASGAQNASFVFTQVVNDTNPIFYYCGVPTHCQKGMFGIINPPNALAQPSSVDNMVSAVASNNSATAAAWASTKNFTGPASTWGGGIDISGMSGWAQSAMVENVMFTRSVMAANPNAIQNGQLDLGSIDLANLMIPPDVAALAASTGTTSATPSSAASPAASAAASGASSPTNNGAASKNGAGALASPRVAVAFVAVAAAFFAL